MADIIQLLPDAIANQIAAGEVIQRPASVVKELMENAIDAGATSVKLIVKEAGKTLLQVIDNGCGMSETDARMSFERHATSKIRAASDLFAIRTMGFRGEALASIAAVAQVEMRSRRHSEELGTRLLIEGSEVKTQEACQCMAGTSISVRNLFFNVPARRNFLKTNTVEMRHMLDEFQRIAVAHSDIFFSLHHNGSEIFHLPKGSLRQRIVGIFGANSNKKLVPVEEDTEALRLYGFVGKPEFAKKVRGEQLIFVNQRFIKSGYLNHAIMGAFEDLLPKKNYPLYVIFIDIDPSTIDINVHPTKQEIKFEDERLVYNYLKVSVRHALGRFSIMPTLDFDQEPSFSQTQNFGLPEKPTGHLETKNQSDAASTQTKGGGFVPKADSSIEKTNLINWQKLYEGLDELDEGAELENKGMANTITIESEWPEDSELDDPSGSFSRHQKEPYQIHGTYIITQIKSGFILVDQQTAHERILYEKYLEVLEERAAHTQKELFSKTITVAPADAAVLKDILPQINLLGFDIQEFGKESFVIQGLPADFKSGQNEQKIIEKLLEQYKENLELKLDLRENIARAMARSTAIKRGQILTAVEMRVLIDQLFACAIPFKGPSGKDCFLTFELDDLEKRFL